MTSSERPDDPSAPAPERTLTENLLGLVIAAGVLLAGIALLGLMLTTDQNMIGIVVAVLLMVMGVRQLIKAIRTWRPRA